MSENYNDKDYTMDYSGVNRCRRCDRPLKGSEPYGWRCAQILGYGNYNSKGLSLDSGEAELYNAYVEKYGAKLESESYAKENLYGANELKYASTNKVAFLPETDWRTASDIILRNADAIKHAGKFFGVNPGIIAACIYTEQTTNVNILDKLTDVPAYFADTSIGIGQVKVSTARMLEDSGYMPKTELAYTYDEWHGNSFVRKEVWYAPAYGYVEGNRDWGITKRLEIESENINYVAAYLAYLQDRWRSEYPEIDGHTDILASLYNLGKNAKEPNPNPKPNPFGIQAKKEYAWMRTLLGLD